MKNYRGWTIKYEKLTILGNGIGYKKPYYIATKDGIELMADSRVGIERKIDANMKNSSFTKTPAKKS